MAGHPVGVGRMGSGSAVGHVVGVGGAGFGVGMGIWGSVGSGGIDGVGTGRAGPFGALAALALQQAMTREREMPARPASARRRR
jgi:hypothetical protein